MKLLVIKQLNQTLKAAYDSDLESLKKIKAGDIITVEITRNRSSKFMRKYFALLNLTYSNQSQYNSFDHLRHDLTIEAGYYDVKYNHFTGERYFQPKSISFSKMEEADFEQLYNRTVDVIIRFLGCEKQEIAEMIEQYF